MKKVIKKKIDSTQLDFSIQGIFYHFLLQEK